MKSYIFEAESLEEYCQKRPFFLSYCRKFVL